MTLAYHLLPPRRIWWFLTDWKTLCMFDWPCSHCGQNVRLNGVGFHAIWFDHHDPTCKQSNWLNWPNRHKWRRCLKCFRRDMHVLLDYIGARWDFRKKWNWGIEK